jgi:type I restriction enzyme M protein
VNTNLLFFQKGNPTKEVWFYELPLPEGMKQYTKNRGIRDEEFDPVRKWWKKRTQNEHAWKVSIKEIEARNYNLDFKNPSKNQTIDHQDPKEILEGILKMEGKIAELLGEIRSEI